MKLIKKNYNFALFEPFIIIAFWALLFASPLLFGRFENQIEWNIVFKVWINYLPLLALFLINRFILLPKLFFKSKRLLYFGITSVIILIIAFGIYSFDVNNNKDMPFMQPPAMELGRVSKPSANAKRQRITTTYRSKTK